MDIPINDETREEVTVSVKEAGEGAILAHYEDEVNVDQMAIYDNIEELAFNLIVNYIPEVIQDSDLLDIFKEFGSIISVKVVCNYRNKKSLGYGFVKFMYKKDSDLAIETMNGAILGDKSIKVSYARPQAESFKNCKIYVTNLPRTLSDCDVETLFGECGEIIECRVLRHKDRGVSRGIAFIQFATQLQATKGLSRNGISFGGSQRRLCVKLADPNQARHKALVAANHAQEIDRDRDSRNPRDLRAGVQSVCRGPQLQYKTMIVGTPSPSVLTVPVGMNPTTSLPDIPTSPGTHNQHNYARDDIIRSSDNSFDRAASMQSYGVMDMRGMATFPVSFNPHTYTYMAPVSPSPMHAQQARGAGGGYMHSSYHRGTGQDYDYRQGYTHPDSVPTSPYGQYRGHVYHHIEHHHQHFYQHGGGGSNSLPTSSAPTSTLASSPTSGPVHTGASGGT